MLDRRDFLATSGAISLGVMGCASRPNPEELAQTVNDVHSHLNPTRVSRIPAANSADDIQAIVNRAAAGGRSISVAGGRHAMGGQQFGTDAVLIDTRRLDRVISFDRDRGLIEVEAGIQWPALMQYLIGVQAGETFQWGIAQKQTGADRLTIGGAIAANIHGRGLKMKPFIGDVEALTLIDARGGLTRCSRTENSDLFCSVVGGYGLFGIVYSATLRLTQRQKVERVVDILDVADFVDACERSIGDGFLYGDLQYATDPGSADFMKRGVFSRYRPVDWYHPMPANQRVLSESDWERLAILAHVDKAKAYKVYAEHYLSTSGQIYWSDTHQLSAYVDDYHASVDRALGSHAPGSEMITEIYVPRAALAEFMRDAADELRRSGAEVIYGTIRLVERDSESHLAWAREPWACVIFNLHVEHNAGGEAHATEAFRRLIDVGIAHGGSYYLTYHRWATRGQVAKCHPGFVEFLRRKKTADPDERFQSDWYRHYRAMFADLLA
jgi:FAD/FMN-containing dehydrogenase